MSEASAEPDIALTLSADHRDLFLRARRDPYFLACVFLALAAHLLLFIGFRPHARVIGDPGGVNDPIAVSIITSNELKQLSPQSAEASAPPPQPPPAPPTKEPSPEPAPPPEAQPSPPAEAQAPPQPAEPPAPQPLPAAAQPEQPQAEAQKPASTAPVLDPVVPEGLVAPSPKKEETKKEEAKTEAKPEEPKPKREAIEETPPEPPKPQVPQKPRKTEAAKAPPKQKSAALDLRMPPPSANSFAGKRAGVERPPGITRSGENDAFAQGVIRALQATMPQMSTVGRVTVRITLDMNGNVVRTEVVRPSDDPILDQSVVFATKQSNFPLPPLNAKPQDLVFVVTYNYTVR